MESYILNEIREKILKNDEKQRIINYIKENFHKSNKEIGEELGESTMRISALRSWSDENRHPRTQIKETKAKFVKKQQIPSYTNADGLRKQEARDQIISSISTSNINTGDVLTLPFSTCEIEKQLNQKYRNKFRYIGCEREEDVYYEMLKTIANERLIMNTHLGTIGDKIYTAHPNEYSHLILDYCGQISTFQEEIKHAINYNIVQVGGTIAVTLCKRGELKGKIAEKINALPENFVSNDKIQSYAIKLFFSEFAGANYKIETFMEYHDDGKMPMVLIILKRLG